jgi:small subunit ribosomal protein S8
MLSLTHFLSKLQNAARSKQLIVHFPYSKISFHVAEILKSEGFIQKIEVTSVEGKNLLWVVLKIQKSQPVIQKIQQYSTCGRSVFWALQDFPTQGLYILSTSKGILTNQEAFKQQIGGQVLCRVFSV